MIITKLSGGLGNQMLQYAFAKTTARKLKTSFKFDLSWFSLPGTTPREFMLKIFPIKIEEASKKEILMTKIPINGNKYFDGYWQNFNYFKDIEKEIKKDFSFPKIMDTKIRKYTNMIKTTNSVAVHIRRGDYMKHEKLRKIFYIQPPSYYKKAIAYIKSKISDPTFFVFAEFSEEFLWFKKNIKTNNKTIYLHNREYEDMRLMSLCKHNIVANSTYSSWAAWLNKHPKKIVVSPKKWYFNLVNEPVNLILKEWIFF